MVIAAAALALAIQAAPERIVSTAPSITQMLYALGLGERVAAVTTFCRYPPEAARKPKIGDYLRPNLELILAARPDLVIVERTGVKAPLERGHASLPILEVDDGTLAGIFDSLERIGRATGVPGRARALAARLRAELDELARQNAGRRPPRTMIVLGRTPARLEGLVVAGRGSYLDELIGLAGGLNIFSDTVAPYSRVPLETVLARDPEVILDVAEMDGSPALTPGRKRAILNLWRSQPELSAVRAGRVFAEAPDLFVVPGPRVAEAARALARLLHPR
ncbi:MAG: helical backbone metal receptor [Bryobacterales bacterium]|nr:helical backbone metal receptor [Bryobacteraceae bacterium]MDW8130501.1 helical backbone metal receptor [Bryobacterales bacterium]